MIFNNKDLLIEGDDSPYGDFFNEWRVKRVDKLISIFGIEWFKNKKILEMGCAYGSVGLYLHSLGSKVHFCDGREETINYILKKNPDIYAFHLDQEEDWELKETYDLIIHFGILYNLNYWERDLEKVLKHCKYLALETAVTKFNNTNEYKILRVYEPELYGPLRKIGTLTSSKNIEKVFEKNNFTFLRYDDQSLNTYHKENITFYNWKEESDETAPKFGIIDSWWETPYNLGKRRFWIATNKN